MTCNRPVSGGLFLPDGRAVRVCARTNVEFEHLCAAISAVEAEMAARPPPPRQAAKTNRNAGAAMVQGGLLGIVVARSPGP